MFPRYNSVGLIGLLALVVVVALVCGGAAAAQAMDFELHDCIRQMEAEFGQFEIPAAIQRRVDIIRANNPGARLLLLDSPGPQALEAIFATGQPEECGQFRAQVVAKMRAVECTKLVDMDRREHREAVAQSLLDPILASIGVCSI